MKVKRLIGIGRGRVLQVIYKYGSLTWCVRGGIIYGIVGFVGLLRAYFIGALCFTLLNDTFLKRFNSVADASAAIVRGEFTPRGRVGGGGGFVRLRN